MTVSIHLFVFVLGLVLLALAALKVPEYPRVSFGWAGLFLWALSTVIRS